MRERYQRQSRDSGRSLSHTTATLQSHLLPWRAVVRKNSIRLPSDRDVGTYLYCFPALESPKASPAWQKTLLSRADRMPS
jgi:hypothetical protein